ncbi:response regulator transcription factor [Planobispora longispora]|uniref:DNA-binding response regulator n=1 Tax=Planobispora longispora TaxID=28887 RepID=A0A8J3W9K1_9ACTN|nr:response regulator transcription factor [Planobispora longispora]BFE78188.1 response regulator transcription factor [Planobispora longispora]GIH80882.1 DNA-binding response regulator [Planobispora longispora]
MPEETIRVLLADDHPVYRDGLAVLLGSIPGIEVAGTAADGAEAVERAADLQPDVIVMDVRMPGLDGIEATRRIVADSPHIGVVVLTMSEEDATLFAAMRAGARGYLLKGAGQAEIVRAITAVAHGETIFGPAVASRVAEFFQNSTVADNPVFPQLTSREREILALVAAGRSNAQIASALFLSPKTVRNNVSNIFAKLHVADRAEAIVRAREAGLGR